MRRLLSALTVAVLLPASSGPAWADPLILEPARPTAIKAGPAVRPAPATPPEADAPPAELPSPSPPVANGSAGSLGAGREPGPSADQSDRVRSGLTPRPFGAASRSETPAHHRAPGPAASHGPDPVGLLPEDPDAEQIEDYLKSVEVSDPNPLPFLLTLAALAGVVLFLYGERKTREVRRRRRRRVRQGWAGTPGTSGGRPGG